MCSICSVECNRMRRGQRMGSGSVYLSCERSCRCMGARWRLAARARAGVVGSRSACPFLLRALKLDGDLSSFDLWSPPGQYAPQRMTQLLPRERFLQKDIDPEKPQLLLRSGIEPPAGHNNRHLRQLLTQGTDESNAVHLRHVQIRDHGAQFAAAFESLLQTVCTVGGGERTEPKVF